jgi:toxin FitB
VKYLVDANVLSEPTKPAPDPRVLGWLRLHEHEMAVDPVILGELRYGILILPKGKRRTALEQWFDMGAGRLHCIHWDADTSRVWVELLARLRLAGAAMPVKDSLIAATALAHRLTVVTRNRADFAKTGLPIVDPFSQKP